MNILPISNNNVQTKSQIQSFKGTISLEPVLRRKSDGLRSAAFETIYEQITKELKKNDIPINAENIGTPELPKYIIKVAKEFNNQAKELVETTNKFFNDYVKAVFSE